MPFDDETLLSAYLDGELEPAPRRRVESALRSSPALASRLSDLARVRDAVRALGPPPLPQDLAPSTLQRILDLRAHRLRQAETRGKWRRAALYLSPIVSVAAALFLTWSFTGFGRDPELPKPGVVVKSEPPRPDSIVIAKTAEAANPPVDVEPEEPVPPPSTPARSPELLARINPEREQAKLGDQEILREILEQPQAHRILIPVDSVDEDSQKRVEDSIGLTAHTHLKHARMRLYQGVAIDPEHPDRAVVYALVLDPAEAGILRKNLRRSFPDSSVSETSVEPSTLAQLTETVHLDVFESTPAGSILASSPLTGDHRHALRKDSDEPRTEVEEVTPDGFPPRAFTGPVPPALPRPTHQPALIPRIVPQNPDVPEERQEEAVYLVWLYERASREDPRRK